MLMGGPTLRMVEFATKLTSLTEIVPTIFKGKSSDIEWIKNCNRMIILLPSTVLWLKICYQMQLLFFEIAFGLAKNSYNQINGAKNIYLILILKGTMAFSCSYCRRSVKVLFLALHWHTCFCKPEFYIFFSFKSKKWSLSAFICVPFKLQSVHFYLWSSYGYKEIII